MTTEQRHEAGDLRVVLATNRPIVRGWFAGLDTSSVTRVSVAQLPLSSGAVAAASEVVSAADVGVFDASIELTEALQVCAEMRACQPALPVAALFCCPESATPMALRALLDARVRSFLSLEVSAEETLRLLRGLAGGRGVIHVRLGEQSTAVLLDHAEDAALRLSDDDIGILKLVALGLSDHEIGQRVFLSPHTVKHRIERLRRRARARNRIELAAWAGRLEASYTARATPTPRPEPEPSGLSRRTA